jgi:exonuclease SbcC
VKINRLTIAGFGPYKTAQTIDFDAFDSDGIFLITGNTGAGKSSILDAICFALYAGVPRYEATQQQLRSDYCEPGDPSYVELWFTSGTTSYRVRRSPEYEQPKKRGTGTTKKPATAELFVRTGATVSGAQQGDDDWQGLAAIPRDVAHELDGILGLSKDQFLQVILLAQNRFQRFLHAKNDERQTVLQSLFGTRRFADIERALVARRKALEERQAGSADAIGRLATQLDAIVGAGAEEGDVAVTAEVGSTTLQRPAAASDEPRGEPGASGVPAALDRDWFEQALEVAASGMDSAETRVREADAAFDSADSALRALENTRRLQARRDEASARLVELERLDESIDDDRQRVEGAGRAEIVWAHVTAAKTANSALDVAADAEQAARLEYEQLEADGADADSDLSPTALAAEAAEITRLLGALEAALSDEKRLPRLEREVAGHEKSVEKHNKALAAATARVESLPSSIEQVVEQRSDALVAAAARPGAAERVATLREQREAAARLDAVRGRLDAARGLEKTRSTASLDALAQYDAKLTRRLDGHAAELASTLVDGEPCAVCGSTEHPNPTSWSARLGEPVTDADLDEARELQRLAAEALAEAGLAVQKVASEHAAAEAASGGRPLAELDAEFEVARASEEAASLAESQAAQLEKRVQELRAQLEAATAEIAALRIEGEAARAVLAAAVTERAAVEERLVLHRGEFGSVADRVEHVQSVLETTRRFEQAMLARAQKRRAAEDAEATLRDQLAEQEFSDAAEATAARLTPAQRAAAAARISAHDLATGTARATLAEDELQSLPAEPVELEAATEARTEARSARDQARAAASTLGERVKRARGLVAEALELLDASETLRLEYETLRSLANSVEGNEPNTMRMRLESYVLAAQLEEIIRAANARLRAMTSGRYTLQHDDSVQYRNTRSGLGIAILDEHTGRARATHSLSGGETFLASLALALGLAEVVSNQAGGITLDTLFIDEGFGSLDADTLAIAMSTLDGLRAGGRTIGLISHVDAMKEQIPSRLRITVTPQGYSEIEEQM